MCGNMLFMDPQKSWLLIGRAKLISTNGPSFTFCTQPLQILMQINSYVYLFVVDFERLFKTILNNTLNYVFL